MVFKLEAPHTVDVLCNHLTVYSHTDDVGAQLYVAAGLVSVLCAHHKVIALGKCLGDRDGQLSYGADALCRAVNRLAVIRDEVRALVIAAQADSVAVQRSRRQIICVIQLDLIGVACRKGGGDEYCLVLGEAKRIVYTAADKNKSCAAGAVHAVNALVERGQTIDGVVMLVQASELGVHCVGELAYAVNRVWALDRERV